MGRCTARAKGGCLAPLECTTEGRKGNNVSSLGGKRDDDCSICLYRWYPKLLQYASSIAQSKDFAELSLSFESKGRSILFRGRSINLDKERSNGREFLNGSANRSFFGGRSAT